MKKEEIKKVKNYLKKEGFIVQKANFGIRSYPMCYGKDVVSKLDTILDIYNINTKILVVSDPITEDLYKDKILNSLEKRKNNISWIKISGREEDKNIDEILKLYQSAIDLGVDKSSVVIALGGGVVQDFVNYFSCTFNRGIKFIQIPTTLLSQADIGIGGCSVNHSAGKSLIGQFYQPILAVLDESFLYSLPKDQISSGISEMINKVICLGGKYNKKTKEDFKDMVNGDFGKISKYVLMSNKVKLKIIESDEIGITGERLLLDWGHTVTHALERVMHYEIGHGFALGIGMVSSTNMSVEKGYLSEEKAKFLEEIIKTVLLPTKIPESVTIQEILNSLIFDQKKQNGKTRFILMKDFGKCFMSEEVSDELIGKVLIKQITK